MESTIATTIRAAPELVYRLAADVERWPRILPHYRWVRRLSIDGPACTLDMAARRDFYPVRWTARVTLFPETRRIRFTHVAGPTRGMEVEWRIDRAGGDIAARVEIWHRFTSSRPLIAPLYEWVAFHVFIANIAGKTLRCMKREAEREAAGGGQ